jgi:hypothetical protein
MIIAFILAPMIIGPFLVKYSHWVSARVNINLVSPDMLDQDIRAFIDQAKIEFETLGFQFVGYMVLADYIPRVTSYFGLFRHEADMTSGMAAVIKDDSGKAIRYCEFSSKYSNGRVINVNNSPIMRGYKNPDKINYRYPRIRFVKQLYEINKWITRHDNQTASLVGIVKGRELEMVSDDIENEVRLQVTYNYYVPDENRARYRLTWQGAIVMTAKQIFPIKNVLAFFDLQSARRAIADMPY